MPIVANFTSVNKRSYVICAGISIIIIHYYILLMCVLYSGKLGIELPKFTPVNFFPEINNTSAGKKL